MAEKKETKKQKKASIKIAYQRIVDGVKYIVEAENLTEADKLFKKLIK